MHVSCMLLLAANLLCNNIHVLGNSQDWVDVQAKTGSMSIVISNHARYPKITFIQTLPKHGFPSSLVNCQNIVDFPIKNGDFPQLC